MQESMDRYVIANLDEQVFVIGMQPYGRSSIVLRILVFTGTLCIVWWCFLFWGAGLHRGENKGFIQVLVLYRSATGKFKCEQFAREWWWKPEGVYCEAESVPGPYAWVRGDILHVRRPAHHIIALNSIDEKLSGSCVFSIHLRRGGVGRVGIVFGDVTASRLPYIDLNTGRCYDGGVPVRIWSEMMEGGWWRVSVEGQIQKDGGHQRMFGLALVDASGLPQQKIDDIDVGLFGAMVHTAGREGVYRPTGLLETASEGAQFEVSFVSGSAEAAVGHGHFPMWYTFPAGAVLPRDVGIKVLGDGVLHVFEVRIVDQNGNMKGTAKGGAVAGFGSLKTGSIEMFHLKE